MTVAPPLLLASATEQARRIAAGTLGGGDLLRQQLAAIDALNPEVNAFVATLEPEPLPTLATPASPLAGTCFAVKDNIDVRGVPSHAGLRAAESTCPWSHPPPLPCRSTAAPSASLPAGPISM